MIEINYIMYHFFAHMNNHHTRIQHQVPQFYLRLWGDENKKVWQYDLESATFENKSIKRILYGEYYYEEDPNNPDNRVENILSNIETKTAPVLKELNNVVNSNIRYSQRNDINKRLKEILTNENQDIIKEFAAFQYLRIPGAIEQKRIELQNNYYIRHRLDAALNPGQFVDTGFNYIRSHFMSLGMLVNYSYDTDFLTSDWPCFDMEDSDSAPFIGEEIGRSSEVVACMPLGPRIRVIFFPKTISRENNSNIPDLIVNDIAGGQVRNHNTLIVQQCIRYVISRKTEEFIFKISAKRKRNSF